MKYVAATLILASFVLTSCGQSGPLFLPPQDDQKIDGQ